MPQEGNIPRIESNPVPASLLDIPGIVDAPAAGSDRAWEVHGAAGDAAHDIAVPIELVGQGLLFGA